MSFFVTSIGTGVLGGDLGGLMGADARCQALAASVGQGEKEWRAFLADGSANVRPGDRIGSGPWFNAFGERIVEEGCETTNCAEALLRDGLAPRVLITERGDLLDYAIRGALLLGADSELSPSGDDCEGWSSSTRGSRATLLAVTGTTAFPARFRFSETVRVGCDLESLRCGGGDGHFLCFVR